MAELIELLELVHSYNWQVTHWATDAAEEALALLTVVTATDHAKELEEATSQVGDILPRRATQHPQRDPPDALHVYRAQRALRQLHPFLEGEMRRLGEQALNQLGAWMPSHWGEAVQLLSSDEEAPTGQQNHDEEGVHDGGDVLGTTMPDGTAGRPVLQRPLQDSRHQHLGILRGAKQKGPGGDAHSHRLAHWTTTTRG